MRSKAKTNQPHSFCEYGNFAEKVLRDRGEHCASPSHQYIFDTMTIVDANTFPNRLPSAQRAVTASQNGFGAHNCNPLRLRKFYHGAKALGPQLSKESPCATMLNQWEALTVF